MQSLFFWNNWLKDYRLIWYCLLLLLMISAALMWYHYFLGASAVIDWEKLQKQKTIETTIHTFRLGPFHLTVPAESYVLFEYFTGSDITHNFFASYSFLIVVSLALVIMLSLITILERFWYFIGLSLFIVTIVSLRLDVLALFGARSMSVTIVVLLFYLGVSFYFRYFKLHTSFIIRCATFSAMTAIFAIAVHYFAEANFPFLHLAVTAYVPALIISLIFILMIAHEIIAAFVYMTNDSTSKNAHKHFSLITFIYLVNVIITALHEMGVVNWDFLYINIFLLLTISAVLGIWAYKIREPQYENLFPFYPFGAFFIITMAIVCFITISQLLGNANDAALKVIRDITIFSHAGFGIVFFIYFVSNFMAMMAERHRVYELLYKPNRMPYFTFRFAGLIATLAFVFYSHWREYIYHATAGFYNYIGDLHLLQDNDAFAISFYEQSRSRAFQNNRANYALATLKTSRLSFEAATTNYEQANAKRPTEFSLVNEGNMWLWTKQYFDAIRTFRKAHERMPSSEYLSNNLGYTYAKVHAIDSATFYLSQARDSKNTKQSGETNFLAMAAMEYLPINTDSVFKLFDTQSPSVAANAVALANLFRQPLDLQIDPLQFTKLNLYSATFFNNYIIQHAKDVDTTFLSKANKIALDSNNFEYSEALRSALAHAYYHQGNVSKALEILGELAYITQNYQGLFNYTMGLWSLEQGDPMLAASYFRFAENADYKQGKFYYAISLTEARDTRAAIVAWDSVAAKNDIATQQLAIAMKSMLSMNLKDVLSMEDKDKYQFARYRIGIFDSTTFNTILSSLENPNYKAQALLDRTNELLKADKLVAAIRTFNKIAGLELTDKRLYESIQYLELRMLAIRKEVYQIAEQINKGITFDRAHETDKLLYTSIMHEMNGDSARAEAGYAVLGKANPFFEEGVIAAVEFYKSRYPDSMKAYNVLVEAIYTNKHSIRLLRVYANEATRLGFHEYAASAIERMRELEIFYR